jgi:cell division septum initiation protein DivIVA
MGVSADTGNPDLMLALQGGEQFVARLREMETARKSTEAAVIDLHLGRSAKVAFDEARQTQAEAEALLARAKKQAEELVANASAQAQLIVGAANEQRDTIVAESHRLSAESEALAAQMVVDRERMQRESAEAAAAVAKLKAELVIANAMAQETVTVQRAAEVRAHASHERLQQKIAKLNAAIVEAVA